MDNVYPQKASPEFGEGVVAGPYTVFGMLPLANAANRRQVRQDYSRGRIGARTIIGAHCIVYAGVLIGDDCRLGDRAIVREATRIGARCVIGTNVDIQYGALIGDDVQILNATQIAGGTVIGSNTFIGPGVQTANDPHLFKFPASEYQDRGRVAPIIGAGVQIGTAAVILPGVTIGDGARIYAGAVVTKDVAAGASVKGMPARVIMREFKGEEMSSAAASLSGFPAIQEC